MKGRARSRRAAASAAILGIAAAVAGALVATGPLLAQPDVASLEPLPELSLAGVEDAVRGAIEDQRREVERLLAAARAGEEVDRGALAAAVGALGELYLVYDFSEAAEAALANAATLAPDQARWPYLSGTLQQLDRRWSEAEESYRRVLELRPDDGPALARLAEVVLQQERWDEAGQLFTRLGSIDGFGLYAAWGLGRATLGRSEPAAAVPLLEAVLEASPESGEVRYPLALAHRDAGDPERARELLQGPRDGAVGFPDPIVVELRGAVRGVGALLVLGRQAVAAGSPELAERRFREAVALDPNSAHAHQSLASLLRRLGRVDEAFEEYERALELDPGLSGLRSFVGGLSLSRARSRWEGVVGENERPRLDQLEEPARSAARRELERAVEHLEITVAQAPDYVEGWLQLAEARGGLGDLAGAADALAEAYRQQPLPELARQQARLLAELGELDQAVATLDAVESGRPEDLALRFEAARLLETAGRLDEAERRFTVLSQTAPDATLRSLSFFHLGTIAVERGDLDLAITRYQSSLAEDPASATASYNLATLYGRLGRYDEAARYHAAAREREPDNHTARYGEALALVLAGRHADARQRLEQALERFPEGARYALLLARLLVASPVDEVRDGRVGLDLARRLMEAAPSLEHAETVAMGLAEIGRFEEAVDWQQRAVDRLEEGGDAVPAQVLTTARERLDAYRAERPWRSPVDDAAPAR